jgi:hypothetical protein
LLAIDILSGKNFAFLGENGGSMMKHSAPGAVSAAKKLQLTYGHIPELNEVLVAIQKKTVGN